MGYLVSQFVGNDDFLFQFAKIHTERIDPQVVGISVCRSFNPEHQFELGRLLVGTQVDIECPDIEKSLAAGQRHTALLTVEMPGESLATERLTAVVGHLYHGMQALVVGIAELLCDEQRHNL